MLAQFPARLLCCCLPALACCLPAQAGVATDGPPTKSGFGFRAPGWQGAFANVLGDRAEFRLDRHKATGTFVALGVECTLRGEIANGRFAGQAQPKQGTALDCSGEFDGEVLHLTIGASSWRLRPTLPLDPTLAGLGEPELDEKRQWTIAVYLSADNDLESAAIADLLEMQKGIPAEGVEVVVLLDRWKGPAGQQDDSWTDARVLRVRPGDDGTFTTLGEPRERDMGDPATLASFVTGVFRKYPAPHHAVFLWDHGRGWEGMGVDEDAPGSKNSRTLLSLLDLRAGLRSALLACNLLRLDLVAFDACMMAQLEVALAMHDLARIMLASEAVVPGSGYPYTEVLPHFANSTDALAISKAIVDDYATFSEHAFKSGSTLAAFHLEKAKNVALRLETVASEAKVAAATQWAAIARALFFAECYEVRQERTDDAAVCSIDLMDLSSRLRGIPGIADEALDNLQLGIAALVIARHAGAERTLSKGLSIYGPHRQGQYDKSYDSTPIGVGGTWPSVLKTVHGKSAADQSPIEIGDFRLLTATGEATSTAHPFGGERLLFSATGQGLVEVQQHTMQYDEGGKVWLLLRRELVADPLWPQRWATAAAADTIDLMMPQYQNGRNELFAEQGGLTFAISNGERQAYASLDLSTPSMQAPITIHARYHQKDGTAPQIVQIAFDRAWWKAVSVRPLSSSSHGMARAIEPEAEDTFEFVLETRTDEGKAGAIFTEALAWGEKGFSLLPEADEAGKYRVEMVARTIHGRTQSAHTEFAIADNPDLLAWPKSWKDFDPATLLGTWDQFQVTGPQQYRDLKMTAEVTASSRGDNVLQCLQKGGPTGSEFETHQLWSFEWAGLPCLRVITEVADGQTFCWYGPVRFDRKNGKPALMMKMLNGVGAVWEWRKR
jgi:hypothetical protein